MSEEPKQLDWLETTHHTAQRLDSIAYTLESLVEKLYYVTGKTMVVQAMSDAAFELRELAEKLPEAVGQKLSEDLKQAQEHSGLMLKAALAGAFTKPTENQP